MSGLEVERKEIDAFTKKYDTIPNLNCIKWSEFDYSYIDRTLWIRFPLKTLTLIVQFDIQHIQK